MKSRLMAIAIMGFLVFTVIAPISIFGSDSTVEPDDFVINISGTQAPDKDIDITIANGKSHSWDVYVVNASEKHLDVTFSYVNDNEDVNVESYPRNDMLTPKNVSGGHYYTEGVFTLAIDELSQSYDLVKVVLKIEIMDIDDKSVIQEIQVNFDVKIVSEYDEVGAYNKFLGIFENKLPAPFNSPWVPAIVTIVFWNVIAEVFCIVLAPRIARFLDKHTSDDDAQMFEKVISRLVAALVFLISINQAMDIAGASAEVKSEVFSFTSIVTIAVVLFIAWEVYKVALDGIITKLSEGEDSAVDKSIMPLFLMLGKLVFWIVGVSAILGALGIDLQGILISAGVVSLGITMGAQNVLSQFFSGIVILFTRPFRKGDFLKINDKVYIVKKVKVMFTEFYSWDKDQIITMPNNAVTASTIVNLTKGDEAYRLYIYFSVAYGADLKKAEKVMLDVANSSPLVIHDSRHAAPNVRMTGFEDSGIELRLGVTTYSFGSSITDASALRMAVYDALVKNDIEIPYNRLEVTMLNDCFNGERRPGDTVAD